MMTATKLTAFIGGSIFGVATLLHEAKKLHFVWLALLFCTIQAFGVGGILHLKGSFRSPPPFNIKHYLPVWKRMLAFAVGVILTVIIAKTAGLAPGKFECSSHIIPSRKSKPKPVDPVYPNTIAELDPHTQRFPQTTPLRVRY